jgi:gas vesicle protein
MQQHTQNTIDRKYGNGSSPSYRSGLGYLLIGGGIGATLALLFAPKSGSQLRGDIADVTRKGYEAAAEKARVLNEKSGDLAENIKERAGAVYDFASQKVGGSLDPSDIVANTTAAAESLIEKSNTTRGTGEEPGRSTFTG